MKILSLMLVAALLSFNYEGAGAIAAVSDEPRVVRPRADPPQIPHLTPVVPGPVPIPQVEPAKPGAVPMPEVGGPDPRTLLVPAPR